MKLVEEKNPDTPRVLEIINEGLVDPYRILFMKNNQTLTDTNELLSAQYLAIYKNKKWFIITYNKFVSFFLSYSLNHQSFYGYLAKRVMKKVFLRPSKYKIWKNYGIEITSR